MMQTISKKEHAVKKLKWKKKPIKTETIPYWDVERILLTSYVTSDFILLMSVTNF